jgi:hypothetical protein
MAKDRTARRCQRIIETERFSRQSGWAVRMPVIPMYTVSIAVVCFELEKSEFEVRVNILLNDGLVNIVEIEPVMVTVLLGDGSSVWLRSQDERRGET